MSGAHSDDSVPVSVLQTLFLDTDLQGLIGVGGHASPLFVPQIARLLQPPLRGLLQAHGLLLGVAHGRLQLRNQLGRRRAKPAVSVLDLCVKPGLTIQI